MTCLRFALAAFPQSDYFIYITGQCYPLWPANRIFSFFEQLQHNENMQCVPFGQLERWAGGLDWRINRYWYELPFGRGSRVFPADYPLLSWKEKFWNQIARLIFRMPKRPPVNTPPHGGCAYWALTPSTVRYLLHQARIRKDVRRFFKTAHDSDEMYFHTLLATGRDFSGTITWRPMHYQYWSTTSHPDILTLSDAPALQDAAKTFPLARKFDMEKHADILDWIDQHLLEGNKQPN